MEGGDDGDDLGLEGGAGLEVVGHLVEKALVVVGVSGVDAEAREVGRRAREHQRRVDRDVGHGRTTLVRGEDDKVVICHGGGRCAQSGQDNRGDELHDAGGEEGGEEYV